jgi:very-short-patch-repair endonuclease
VLAGRQHGVVARRQLRELGFTDEAIEHRVAGGRIHRTGWEVFAVGRPHLTKKGRWMAAVLSCGDSAVLSHCSAGRLLGLTTERPAIEVSVRTCSPRRQVGIVAHRRAGIRVEDVGTKDGIPVTAPVRTLVDLAATTRLGEIERLVNEADRLDLVDPETLRSSLDTYCGQRGVARLRAVLDRHSFRLTDSELERWFLPITERAGLAIPLTRHRVNDFKVDFYWPDLELVVETDGLRYHRTPAEQARDRLRDQAHTAAGLTQLRFTHGQIRFEPDHVAAILRDTARRIRNSVMRARIAARVGSERARK